MLGELPPISGEDIFTERIGCPAKCKTRVRMKVNDNYTLVHLKLRKLRISPPARVDNCELMRVGRSSTSLSSGVDWLGEGRKIVGRPEYSTSTVAL